MLTPNEVQAPVIAEFSASGEPGGILAWGTGQGKSLGGTEIARLRGAKRVLIVGPSATLDGWYQTIKWQAGLELRPVGAQAWRIKYAPDHERREVRVGVTISAKESKANLEAVQAGEDGWFFVTREMFTRQSWEKVPVTKKGVQVVDPKTGRLRFRSQRTDAWTRKRPLDVLISDEHQRFANKSNRGQQAFEHADAKFKLVMSKDWFGSQVENMWTVARDTFGAERGVRGMNHSQWIGEYMETEFDPYTWSKQKVVGERWPGFFASTLPLYSVLPNSYLFDGPERWPITLTAAERKAYNKLEEDMVAEVPDGLLVAEMPLTLRIRLRELALGLVSPVHYIDKESGEDKWTVEYRPGAPSAKLEAIKEILRDHEGHKFIIGSHSSKWVRWAARELRDAGIDAASRTGEESQAQRRQDFDRFIEGDLRVLVCHPGTIGEGTDGIQHVCSRIILASRDDRGLMNGQFIDRVARQGQKESVEAWEIVAVDTWDDEVMSNQMRAALERSVASGLEEKK